MDDSFTQSEKVQLASFVNDSVYDLLRIVVGVIEIVAAIGALLLIARGVHYVLLEKERRTQGVRLMAYGAGVYLFGNCVHSWMHVLIQ